MSVVEPGPARVVLLERNRVLSARIARVLGAADALGPVAIVDDPRALAPHQLGPARLIACDAHDLDVAIGWLGHAPRARLVVWSGESTVPLIARAARHEALSNLVGWPSFDSMPRAWELLYVARRLLGEPAPPLRELLPWGAAHTKFRPHTTAELESTVAAVLDLSERAGASPRSALRISEAAHELLMNAMYDAPVDQYGEKRFAFERQRAIELAPEEAPTLRFATDGSKLTVEVVDPFGRLERHTLFAGIARGAAENGATLDASGGGAGLGLARIFGSGSALFVDVVPGERTSVTLVLDLDVRVREARLVPTSLHWFGS